MRRPSPTLVSGRSGWCCRLRGAYAGASVNATAQGAACGLGSLAEQPLDLLDVGGGRDHFAGHPAGVRGRLVLEQVALAGLTAHDLAGAGEAEALLGTAVGLVLRHGSRSPHSSFAGTCAK